MTAVGARAVRLDADVKVGGRGVYTSDVELPRMLHACFVRSPYAHAEVLSVDASAALNMPGVNAVLSADNVLDYFPTIQPYDVTCNLRGEGPAGPGAVSLFGRRVRYVGDPVALVAAETLEIAQDAARRVQVHYRELPAVLTPEAASQPDAPLLHEGAPRNISNTANSVRGDVDAALAQADLVLERRFITSRPKQAQMELTACVVDMDGTGSVTVWAGVHSVHRTQIALAQLFDLPLAKIRVVSALVGGSFGKSDALTIEPYALAMALVTKRPVKIVLASREDFVGTDARHPSDTLLTAGFRADGMLLALRARAVLDGGAYRSHSTGVVAVFVRQLCNAYHIKHVDIQAQVSFTNTPTSGAFRGYGGPQAAFAIEHMIDLGARALGKDPLEAREAMRIREGDAWGVHREPIVGDGFGECIARGAQAVDWYTKRTLLLVNGSKRRGVGMACAVWISSGFTAPHKSDKNGAAVRINLDGTVLLAAAGAEIGTGIRTTLAQICADELGVPLDMVYVTDADTAITPYDTGATASRSLYRLGQAVQCAAGDVRMQILAHAARYLNVSTNSLDLRNGVVVDSATDTALELAQVARAAFQAGQEISAYGTTPDSNAPTFAAQFAEVEVDTETGQVTVLRLVAAHDVGRAINPTIVEGQIEGGVVQGLGYALAEGLLIDPHSGAVVIGNHRDYRIPLAADCPPIETILIETIEPSGPFGAKGAGEPGIIPTAAAVANAILHAVGTCPTELPLTPERVWQALQEPVEDLQEEMNVE